ncbi:MAG: hypothetical protein ACR2HO_00860 [Rubrobacteraceae bacterium]
MSDTTRLAHLNIVEISLGDALEWAIQRWMLTTGQQVRVEDAPWLAGPIGKERIGAGFYEEYAQEAGLEIVTDDPDAGLLPEFDALAGGAFDPLLVRPEIRDFYERTARHGLDVRPQWSRVFRYPPKTLIHLVSRNIQQLNLPISPSGADAGMSSELIRLSDPATRAIPFTGWLRRSAATGAVIYAGFYTTCELPDHGGRFVKVVFPLPDGSATVVLRPENRPDGSFALVSNGDGFGDAGYYRVHRGPDGTLLAKYMPVKEEIHVYVDRSGTLRTTHTLALWKARFLTLRYEISRHGQGRSLPSSSCQ